MNQIPRTSPLRRRMTDDMTIRNLSPATQRSYLHAVQKISRYFQRSPEKLSLEDVRLYQIHLAGKGISWASLNQTVCALRFFYGVTLGQDEVPERIPYPPFPPPCSAAGFPSYPPLRHSRQRSSPGQTGPVP